MSTCHHCGNEYPEEYMADWTICFSCMREAQREMGYAYTDSLGIGWTEEDIANIGGICEIERLIQESK